MFRFRYNAIANLCAPSIISPFFVIGIIVLSIPLILISYINSLNLLINSFFPFFLSSGSMKLLKLPI